jgi:hypothetical protein
VTICDEGGEEAFINWPTLRDVFYFKLIIVLVPKGFLRFTNKLTHTELVSISKYAEDE